MERKKIGIIGGGKYGQFWLNFFRKLGFDGVRMSDVGTVPSNEEIAEWANVIIIAVSLMETTKVIKSLLDILRPDQLIIDLASTKTDSTDMMLASKSEVLGLHPFCAPPTKRGTFKGQTMFVYRARLSGWAGWVDALLTATEARIQLIEPESHDRERTVDQVIEHLCTLLKASVMRRMELDASKLFATASPVYKLTLAQMARMFIQSASLYGALPMTNRLVNRTLDIFQEELDEFRHQVATGDLAAYSAVFDANHEHIGDATVNELFELSEQMVSLMGDLIDPHSLKIVIASDGPGVLEKVGLFFREAGINITAFHSRRVKETIEFFVAFEADRRAAEVLSIEQRLVKELGATVL